MHWPEVLGYLTQIAKELLDAGATQADARMIAFFRVLFVCPNNYPLKSELIKADLSNYKNSIYCRPSRIPVLCQVLDLLKTLHSKTTIEKYIARIRQITNSGPGKVESLEIRKKYFKLKRHELKKVKCNFKIYHLAAINEPLAHGLFWTDKAFSRKTWGGAEVTFVRFHAALLDLLQGHHEQIIRFANNPSDSGTPVLIRDVIATGRFIGTLFIHNWIGPVAIQKCLNGFLSEPVRELKIAGAMSLLLFGSPKLSLSKVNVHACQEQMGVVKKCVKTTRFVDFYKSLQRKAGAIAGNPALSLVLSSLPRVHLIGKRLDPKPNVLLNWAILDMSHKVNSLACLQVRAEKNIVRPMMNLPEARRNSRKKQYPFRLQISPNKDVVVGFYFEQQLREALIRFEQKWPLVGVFLVVLPVHARGQEDCQEFVLARKILKELGFAFQCIQWTNVMYGFGKLHEGFPKEKLYRKMYKNLHDCIHLLFSDFNKAAEDVKNLKSKPTDDELLEIYALFKQANFGDNETGKPGMLDFKGKAKWERWLGKKGLSKDDAMTQYIAKAKELIDKYGLA